MRTIDNGFDAEEIADPDLYTAYLAICSQRRGVKSPFLDSKKGAAGAYLLRIAGGGKVAVIWGAVLATHDDAIRGLGICHALRKLPEDRKLVVRTRGLVDHLRRPDGHARIAQARGGLTGAGEPFDGYEIYSELLNASDSGQWRLEPIKTKALPHGCFLADEMVKGKAFSTALAYRAVHTISEPNQVLADSDDPDPLQLMKRRAA